MPVSVPSLCRRRGFYVRIAQRAGHVERHEQANAYCVVQHVTKRPARCVERSERDLFTRHSGPFRAVCPHPRRCILRCALSLFPFLPFGPRLSGFRRATQGADEPIEVEVIAESFPAVSLLLRCLLLRLSVDVSGWGGFGRLGQGRSTNERYSGVQALLKLCQLRAQVLGFEASDIGRRQFCNAQRWQDDSAHPVMEVIGAW